jgi:hypothetical protein
MVLIITSLDIVMLSAFMLSVVYAKCRKYVHYAEFQHTECHYAECHYAECRSAQSMSSLPYPYCF